MAKTSLLKEFSSFIKRGNAIDMAVGIIVGSVMTGVVNSLVKDVIMPPIGLLIGGVDFSDWKLALGAGSDATINIGLFLNTIVSFFITMFAVFLIVRAVAKARSKSATTTRTCPYCQSSISVNATKCPHCCSDVEPVEIKEDLESDLQKGLKDLSKVATKKLAKIKKVAKIKK